MLPPIEGELVLPPAQSAMNQPARKPGKDLVSHRRPRPARNGQDGVLPPKPGSGEKPSPTARETILLAPPALPSAGQQTYGGNVINLLGGAAPMPQNSPGDDPRRGEFAPRNGGMSGPTPPLNHAVVTWRFRSDGSSAMKPEPPASSVASDAGPVRLRPSGESPLIDSILSPSRPERR